MAKIHPTVRELLREIEAHCRKTGMTRSAFSIAVTGDGHLVRRLYLGSSPTLEMIDRVRAYIREAEKEQV